MSQLRLPSMLTEAEHIERAAEVAPAAKFERSVAAAKRLIDPLAARARALEESDYDAIWSLTTEIADYYQVYPEVFNALFSMSEDKTKKTGKKLIEIAVEIAERGELSLFNIAGWDNEGTAEEFDHKADLVESTTEAMVAYPPTQDFLRSHNLGQEYYLGKMSLGYERRTTVQEIVELSLSADKLRLQAQKVESDFAYTTERYKRFNVNANTNVTRIQKLFNMLDNAIYYIPEGEAKTEFEARVQAAKNSEETMIGYFRELYDEGMTLAIKLINDTAQEKQLTYLAITNGGASTYHNPVTDPTNVANKL